MLFHTWVFAVFFAIFYALYLATRHTRARVPLLLVASWIFYASWEPRYLALVIYSTVIDYAAVRLIARARRARGGGDSRGRVWLWASIANNLALLGFFKYRAFVVENLNLLLATTGLDLRMEDPTPGLLLPVGISFYTFQSMSYTIDYWRGEIEPEPSFVRFAAFVALFPQLVAGPIERARDLLPQMARAPTIRAVDITDGISLFLTGLFKKLALANYLGLWVDRVYASPAEATSRSLLIATFFFGWQIYFDFSGYTDMARGIARAMGLRLSPNFRNPYTAVDLGDFWRRWHLSLSTWFRDYVYVPLGGNRRGRARRVVAIAATMLISGVWHGAAWTFVLWGALHAVGRLVSLAVERQPLWLSAPKILKQAIVFAFVTFAWIFFRAETLDDAFLIVGKIVTPSFEKAAYPALAMALVLAVWVYQLAFESFLRPLLELRLVRVTLALAMLVWLLLVPGSGAEPFIYFQF